MEEVAKVLRWGAINIFYPIILVGTFLFVSVYSGLIVWTGYKKDKKAKKKIMPKPYNDEMLSQDRIESSVKKLKTNSKVFARRLTGALLPFIALVFITTLIEKEDKGIKNLFESIDSGWGLLIGVIVGFLIFTIGYYLKSEGLGPTLFTLFLSTVSVFIIYSIMLGYISSLNYILFGIVAGGGIFIIFIGVPSFDL